MPSWQRGNLYFTWLAVVEVQVLGRSGQLKLVILCMGYGGFLGLYAEPSGRYRCRDYIL